jgi:nucleoside-diphosphate-sugar epimerase
MSDTALVTGGSGFVALELIQQLLTDGDRVHTTVRDIRNKKKVRPLKRLQERFPGQLEIFEANLLWPGSFGPAMQNCNIVFHVATSFLLPGQIRDSQHELSAPAINGTRDVLETANRTPSINRVVMTSTIGAMFGDYVDVRQMRGEILREEYFNTSSTLDTYPYHYSKVEAEKEAWRIALGQSRWSLVTINPGLILGPSLTSASQSGSLFLLDEIMRGLHFYGLPDWWMATVDVRDAARAHITAARNHAATGRYIVAEKEMSSLLGMARILRKVHRYPFLLPTCQLPNWLVIAFGPLFGLSRRLMRTHLGIHFKLDNSRSIKDLGVAYRPLNETLTDHYKSWIELRNPRGNRVERAPDSSAGLRVDAPSRSAAVQSDSASSGTVDLVPEADGR